MLKKLKENRKNLTSGQLGILKKNKIIIPKDFKSNFKRYVCKTNLKSEIKFNRIQRGKD